MNEGTPAVAIEAIWRGEEASLPQQMVERGGRPASAESAAKPPTWLDHDAPVIAIIEPRLLGRDALTQALRSAGSQFRIQAFAEVGEWQDDHVLGETSVILLGIGAMSANDPDLANDLEVLVRDFAHIPTIVMGDIEDSSHVIKILASGARGYIPTSVSLNVAIEAISLARAGGLFVPASCLIQTHRALRKAPYATAPSNLFTERQAAVVDALCRGKANKIIAYELNLCESTVKVHVRNIMKKLQARNRTEVAFKMHNQIARDALSDRARSLTHAGVTPICAPQLLVPIEFD